MTEVDASRPKSFGLYAPGPLKWLIAHEPQLQKAIRAFADDEGPAEIPVAGLPRDPTVIPRYLENKDRGVELPVIRVQLKKTRHHLSLRPIMVASLSDEDMDELERWIRVARSKQQLAGGDAFLRG